MALQVAEQWEQFFTAACIPSTKSKMYTATFVTNHITETMLPILSKDYLTDLGVTIIGDILAIIQHAKNFSQPFSEATSTTITSSIPTMPNESLNKWPPIRPPEITLDLTDQQFPKFKIDWGMFKQLTNILLSQIAAQLYSLCEDSVQNSILNTNADFFTLSEQDMIQTIETIVTKRSNPAVHHLNFATLSQSEGESMQKLYCTTKYVAQDCEYSRPFCQVDLQSIHVKDQFIRGLHNETLQTDILSEAEI